MLPEKMVERAAMDVIGAKGFLGAVHYLCELTTAADRARKNVVLSLCQWLAKESEGGRPPMSSLRYPVKVEIMGPDSRETLCIVENEAMLALLVECWRGPPLLISSAARFGSEPAVFVEPLRLTGSSPI